MRKLTRIQKIGVVVLLLISVYLLWENTTVGTTVYEVRNQQIAVGMDGITIAHVSDLSVTASSLCGFLTDRK
jgi:branched-subunit amino acid ABC-type transport system permease component